MKMTSLDWKMTMAETTKKCSYAECEKKYFGNGMCSMHYYRERRALEVVVNGPKDRKRRSDSLEAAVADPEDFWEFVKAELKLA